MKIKLIKIGNSMGVRLPKNVITECGFKNDVNLDVRHKMVILTPVTSARQGWEKQISDDLIFKPIQAKGEWQW